MNIKKIMMTGLLASTILVVNFKQSIASSFFDEKYYNEVAPEGYYKRVNLNDDPEVIKETLGQIISANYVKHSYKENNTVLKYTDPDPKGSGKAICIYSGRALESGAWNKEHVWAKSHGFPNESYEPYCDAHHLRPSTTKINSTRSNKDFGEVPNATPDAYGNKTNNDLFEPRDEVKGDIARMMFYMETRYGSNTKYNLKLVNSQTTSASDLNGRFGNLETLIKWHYDDPVSKEEIYRNNVIFDNYQHNRNPYIDHPEYVDYVYPSKYAGTTKPVEPVEPSKPSPDPTPSEPDSSLKLDDYNFKKIESLSDISEGIYLIDGDANYMVSDFMTGKDGVFACSDTPKEIFYLESKSNKWLLKNNQNKYLNIYGKTNSKFETEGTPFEIKEEKGGFNFSSGGFSFCYNKSAPRFTSYASSQGPLILYKATFKNDEAANFENLKISRSLAYHWSTNDNTNYTIDNACIRFGVKLTEEMKNLDGVKFGALVAKEDYMKDIDFKEYIRLTNASDAASVVKGDDNIKYLEFKNIASEGGMTSIRIDDIGASYDTKIVVVIYMEYNGKLYLTEATIGSFKSIASEYLNLNLDLSQDVINSLTQIVK